MESKKNYPLKIRLSVGIGVPLVAIFIAFIFFYVGKTPPCIFFELTGIYCAGCGVGRAFLALLHGDILAALRFNMLAIVLLPLVAYYLLKVYISFVFQRDVLPVPKIHARWVGIVLLAVILAFWVFRNIPVVPFSYLAPTAV